MNHNAVTEHYLVPATLFFLNICLAHVIYAFTAASTYSPASKIAVMFAFLLMAGSLAYKKQFLLTGAMLFYLLVTLAI